MRKTSIILARTNGQALVEMALILFLLLLLVVGIFEFGRAMYTKNTLTHAARAGARAAVVTASIDSTTTPEIPDTNCSYPNASGNAKIFQAVCTSLYSGITKSDVRISVAVDKTVAAPTNLLNNGDMVRVTVSLINFQPVVSIIPVPSTLSGDTAMRYE